MTFETSSFVLIPYVVNYRINNKYGNYPELTFVLQNDLEL